MSSVETNKQTKSYTSIFHLQQETSLWEIWLKLYLITLADMSGGKYVCGYCLDNNYKIIHCLANWITINQFYLLQNWIIFDFLTWGWAHPHQGNKRIEASNAFIEVKRHIHMHAHAYTHTPPIHNHSLLIWDGLFFSRMKKWVWSCNDTTLWNHVLLRVCTPRPPGQSE